MKRIILALLAIALLAQVAFAANTTPIYTLTLPANVSRGDIFNATVTIKSKAVAGVDYSPTAPEYKLTGAMFKLTFPAEDLEMVNAPPLAAAITASGLSITDYQVVNGTFTMTLDKASAATVVTPISIPVATDTEFLTLTFKAIRNSAGSAEGGANCTVTIPGNDNTVIYQTGYDSPESDETKTVGIKSDSGTSGDPSGDATKREIKAIINIEYPASGGSHATALSALYWQQGDANYVSYPGVQAAANGDVQVRMDRIAGKSYRIGFKRASSLVAGIEGTDATSADLSTTVLKLVEGDLNSDNIIDGTDFTLLTQLVNYPPQYVEGLNKTGDVNNDGKVDKLDVFAFNNVINGSTTPRYLKEGFNMTGDAPTNPLRMARMSSAISASTTINGRTYSIPKNSIVHFAKSDEGKYQLSITEDTQKITMLQLVINCADAKDLELSLPDGWMEIGRKVEANRITFAIGNTETDGLIIPKDTVIASFSSTKEPSVIYTGKTPSTMELATKTSVISYNFESSKQASADPAPAKSDGSSSGCNAGIGILAMLALIPLAAKRKSR